MAEFDKVQADEVEAAVGSMATKTGVDMTAPDDCPRPEVLVDWSKWTEVWPRRWLTLMEEVETLDVQLRSLVDQPRPTCSIAA